MKARISPGIEMFKVAMLSSSLELVFTDSIAPMAMFANAEGQTVLCDPRPGAGYHVPLKGPTRAFLALAKDVPDPSNDGKLIPNPYTTWKEINPALPANAIEVLGPPPTSGTRDAFTEMVMVAGAEEFDFIKAMAKSDKDTFKRVSETVREDGAYVEAGENDNLIVQKLQANPKALGVFGFSFLDQNADAIQGSLIEGEAPTFDNISAGKYAVSRPLFIYVKKAHIGVIPGIREYITEFASEKAWGDEGYLADKGMIPMPTEERKKYADDVANLRTM